MNPLLVLLGLKLLSERWGPKAPPWPSPRHPPPRRVPVAPIPPVPPPPPPDAMAHPPQQAPKPRPRKRTRKPAPVRVPPPRSNEPMAAPPGRMPSADYPAPPAPDAPVINVTPQARAAPAPAAGRSPVQAARELYSYVKAGNPLGTKNSPSRFVALAQADMDNIAPDGIYGPATRRRGEELTGRPFPPRTARSNGIYIP